jgi:hypothetical protein
MRTEALSQAKRLFDAERWDEAVKAMREAMSDKPGDDRGNLQLAEFWIAASLHHLQRYAESAAAFRAIAGNRDHVKHRETLLWLARLADDDPGLLELSDFAAYTPEDIAPFDNASQRSVYEWLSLLLARARLAAGATQEARELLGRVSPKHPHAGDAQKCLDWIDRGGAKVP